MYGAPMRCTGLMGSLFKLRLGAFQFCLQLLQGAAFGFGIHGEHDDELHDHHGGKEVERDRAGKLYGGDGEECRDDGVHDPVGG